MYYYVYCKPIMKYDGIHWHFAYGECNDKEKFYNDYMSLAKMYIEDFSKIEPDLFNPNDLSKVRINFLDDDDTDYYIFLIRRNDMERLGLKVKKKKTKHSRIGFIDVRKIDNNNLFVSEYFIREKYRHGRFAHRAIDNIVLRVNFELLNSLKGIVYCVLKKNEHAKEFWQDHFKNCEHLPAESCDFLNDKLQNEYMDCHFEKFEGF